METPNAVDPGTVSALQQELADNSALQTDIMRRISAQEMLANRPKRLTAGQAAQVAEQVTNNIVFESNNGTVRLPLPVVLVAAPGSGTVNVGAYVDPKAVQVILEIQVTGSSASCQTRQDSSYGWITQAAIGSGEKQQTCIGWESLTSTLSFDYSNISATTAYIKIIGYIIKISGVSPTSSGGGVIGSTTFAGLSDVTLSSPVAGDMAVYDGSKWVNAKFYEETPSGTVDGANATFTLAHVPKFIISGCLNGQPIDSGTDYTVASATITTTLTASTGNAAPQTGDELRFRYVA